MIGENMNTNIAMQDISPQFESPMNALAKVLNIKQAQQESQMGQMKMDEYTQGVARKNALRQLLGGFGSDHSANQQKLLQGGYMDEAQTYGKNQADILKSSAAAEKDQLANTMQKLALGAQILGSVTDQQSYDQARATAQANGLDVSRMQPNYDPAFVEAKRKEGQTMAQQIEQVWKQKGYDTPDANAVLSAQTSRSNNQATVAQADTNSRRTDQRARDRLTLDQGNQVAEAGGPSQAAYTKQFGKPSAGYRWKADGSQEFIPGGPADQKAQMKTSGEGTVDSVVADLRDKFNQLNEGGGVTSIDRGAVGNIGAGVASSGIGQAAGRMFGTQNQSSRNSIAMTRPLLLQAIMKATGMSAKQMDSNAELKLYLSTATDPTLDLQANMEALDRIEKLYGSGQKVAAPKPAGLKAGDVQDGHRFKGGNPADPKSWEKM